MQSNKLQAWMTKHELRDHHVAAKLKGVSRVQISRIRRGVSGASTKTAMQLQGLTGIRWWHFVKKPPKLKRARKA